MMMSRDVAVNAMFIQEGLMSTNEDYDDLLNAWDRGCVELVCEVAVYAPLLADLSANVAERLCLPFPGVYEYEVSAQFGGWFRSRVVELGYAPSREDATLYIEQLARAFFMSHIDTSIHSAALIEAYAEELGEILEAVCGGFLEPSKETNHA